MERGAARARPFGVRFSILVLAMLAAGLAPYPEPAVASCAAPFLTLDSVPVWERGETVTVEGRAFTDGGCQDSMSCTSTFGCDRCEYDDPPATPMHDVALQLVQDDVVYELGTADAGTAEDNELGWVSWTFEVPDGVQPGRAKLFVDDSELARVRIR